MTLSLRREPGLDRIGDRALPDCIGVERVAFGVPERAVDGVVERHERNVWSPAEVHEVALNPSVLLLAPGPAVVERGLVVRVKGALPVVPDESPTKTMLVGAQDQNDTTYFKFDKTHPKPALLALMGAKAADAINAYLESP